VGHAGEEEDREDHQAQSPSSMRHHFQERYGRISAYMLFHIVDRRTWEAARAAGVYRPASLATEGFIHLSTAEQWPETHARFYAGVADLVLLEIEPTLLSADVRYERADGDDFPHLYGPLEVDAVVNVRRLT
jgi:uncharacterized protein (DUF952 family)